MGKGDYDNGIPQDAKDFKAPDLSAHDRELSDALRSSKEFSRFYQMPTNVDSIRQYAKAAEQEGINPELINRYLQKEIDLVRATIRHKEDGLKTGTIGGGDSFEHGLSATTGYQKTKLEADEKRLAELEALAVERGISLD